MLVDTTELIAASDIRRIAKVAPQTVNTWKVRDATFPKPVATVGTRHELYLKGEVTAWLRRTGRLYGE